jgi:hypothetical protein
VHFVLGKLKLAVADVFIREKFYFLKSHYLRSHQHITM